jgi:hypothetical protein
MCFKELRKNILSFFIWCHPIVYLLSCLYFVFLLSHSVLYHFIYRSSNGTTTSSNIRRSSIQRVLGSVSRGGKAAEVWSWNHFHLMPKLRTFPVIRSFSYTRLRGAIPDQAQRLYICNVSEFDSLHGQEILSSPERPDRLWGPPNLLSNGYWELFPQG